MPRPRILIVEPDRTIAESIKDSLKRLEYSVTGIAVSAEKAIQNERRNRPDLVMMDTTLDKGGPEGIEAAPELSARFNIPVVYLTSCSDKKHLNSDRLTESIDYLLKPIDENKLHVAIEMALYKHEMVSAAVWTTTPYGGVGEPPPL